MRENYSRSSVPVERSSVVVSKDLSQGMRRTGCVRGGEVEYGFVLGGVCDRRLDAACGEEEKREQGFHGGYVLIG